MLPSTAMPSAPPSSEQVSDSADAAPEREGGADPTISSVAMPATGESPSAKTVEPATITPSDPARAITPKPTAASASPPAITNAGRTPGKASGASMAPAMKPADDGSDHKPA